MNIFKNPNIQRLARVFETELDRASHKVRSAEGPERLQKSDSVQLSSEAKLLGAIQQRLAEAPDVRRERVEALKQAIARGTYHVSGEDIADAMIREGKLP